MPARTSCAAMSACRSENPNTRSGCSATIRSILALVKAETLGFSRRARGGLTVKPEMPTIRHSSPRRYRVSVVSSVKHTMRCGYCVAMRAGLYPSGRVVSAAPSVPVVLPCGYTRITAGILLPMWARIWAFLDWCFFGPASTGPAPSARLIRGLRYPYAVVRDLWRGDINLRAMSLVYTTLLSLIPLLAFTFAILKIFGARRDLEPVVYEFFRPVGGQAAQELTDHVLQFARRVSGGIVGSVGFAALAWTLLGTIKKVEDSFNFLWRVEQPRSFARRIAEYLTMLIVGPVLLVAFVGLSHAAMASVPLQTIANLPWLQRLHGVALAVAPYVMVTVFFTGMYMFIPNTRVRWRPALVGAAAAGVLWAAVGNMFTAFVVYSTRLTVVYAGFAFIVTALLWTYSGWLILLAGAQLSFYVQNPA